MSPRHLCTRWHRFASAALLALALGSATVPAHAFWGLLGKAAGGAGKTAGAAGTAGKAAGAGTAAAAGAGAATLADDAARVGSKAGSADAAVAPAAAGAGHTAHAASAVNAALPPEVAVYLAKPAASLTGSDTAAMMGLYQRMVAQAGKTGDFSVIERMPQVHGAKTLPQPTHPVPVPVKAGAMAQPSPATALSASATAEMSLAGLRLLAHAASAGHRAAQKELRERCADPAVLRTAPADVQAACKAAAAASKAAPAKPRPAAT